MNKREECLNFANKCVNGGRDQDYGSPLDCFSVISGLWTTYLGTEISPAQVADMMILMKVARNKKNPKGDNWIDICGYGACGYEIAGGDDEK